MGHAVSCNNGDRKSEIENGRNDGRCNEQSEFENGGRCGGYNRRDRRYAGGCGRDDRTGDAVIDNTGVVVPNNGFSGEYEINDESDYASYSDYVDIFYNGDDEMSDEASTSNDDWEEMTMK